MAKTNIDKELVNTLAKLLHDNNLTEIEYDAEGVRLKVVSNNLGATVLTPVNTSVAKESEKSSCHKYDDNKNSRLVKSPMVGVVYIAPEPGGSPYVKAGDTVKEGQTLFLIEAMKTFNAVKAPQAGKVKSVLVQDAQPVEFDEPLLALE